jgi:V8-like Glu-specific endopeptidase
MYKFFPVLLSFSLWAVVPPSPYIVDKEGKPLYPIVKSLCGPDDMLPLVNTSASLQQMGTPVGLLTITMGSSVGKCSGTLIAKDIFLTARHCEANCNDLNVTFGYLSDGRAEKFRCKKILEKGNAAYENDYLILQLEGNPGVMWGWYEVSDRALEKNHELLIIHHPLGSPMKISKECFLYDQTDKYLNHRCDTQPGSSGSAIMDPDYAHPENTRVVGVHTLGGCNASPSSSNAGPSLKHLVTVSPLLKTMAKK